MNQKKLITIGGVGSLILGVVILLISIVEGFGAFAHQFYMIQAPGFHELNFKSAGLYAGIYQNESAGPLPISDLSRLEFHLMSKKDYSEVQLMSNTQGQVFDRAGFHGMPLFNFVIQEPGDYTLSAVYANGEPSKTYSVLIVSQEAQNLRQTLIVGVFFFLVFLGLGLWLLLKVRKTVKA